MRQKIALVTAGLATLLVLGAASCNTGSSHDNTRTQPSAPTASKVGYDTFLAVLAENGWVPTEADRLAGGTNGVQVEAMGCYIRLALITPTGLDYEITSLNAFPPDDFGERVEAELGIPNITRSDFETKLAALIAAGEFEPCRP